MSVRAVSLTRKFTGSLLAGLTLVLTGLHQSASAAPQERFIASLDQENVLRQSWLFPDIMQGEQRLVYYLGRGRYHTKDGVGFLVCALRTNTLERFSATPNHDVLEAMSQLEALKAQLEASIAGEVGATVKEQGFEAILGSPLSIGPRATFHSPLPAPPVLWLKGGQYYYRAFNEVPISEQSDWMKVHVQDITSQIGSTLQKSSSQKELHNRQAVATQVGILDTKRVESAIDAELNLEQARMELYDLKISVERIPLPEELLQTRNDYIRQKIAEEEFLRRLRTYDEGTVHSLKSSLHNILFKKDMLAKWIAYRDLKIEKALSKIANRKHLTVVFAKESVLWGGIDITQDTLSEIPLFKR